MKKPILASLLCAICMTLAAHPHPAPAPPKYVFYFIGSGMGIASATYTEMAMATSNNSQSLSFSGFANTGWTVTHSANNLIPNTASAATALATGQKTANGRIAMTPDASQPLKSIAYSFKDMGFRTGIVTTLNINYATPAAFYAKQPVYNMYYEIAKDLSTSGIDFIAGAGFKDTEHQGQSSVWEDLEAGGYKISRNIEDVNKSTSRKNVLIQPEYKYIDGLVYAIDKHSDDYTLAQMTQAAVDKLYNPKGFFLMVESGQIDLAASDNDAAAMVGEIMEFSDAVAVALNFYKKYPAQTLIVVTSTHETGGFSIYNENENQRIFFRMPRRSVADRHLFTNEYPLTALSYNGFIAMVKHDYTNNELTSDDEQQLRRLFLAYADEPPASDASPCVMKDTMQFKRTLARFLSRRMGAYFITYKPTAAMVPVWATGAGSWAFRGKMDNTDIPKKILNAVKKKD
jgi:alkaline phosphatase